MINARKMQSVQKENDELERELMSHFEPASEERREEIRKEIYRLEKEKEELNITDELRRKNRKELTEEEGNKLYDEYIINSLIESLCSEIEFGLCDIECLHKYMKTKFGVRIK